MRSKYLKLALVAVMCCLSLASHADLISCGSHEIDKLMTQGNRDDNHAHANSLVMTLKDTQCNGKPYLIIKNDHPAYQGTLSVALAAKLANKPVEVLVNSNVVISSATEISIIIIK